jgi:hypothetical protein
MAETGATWRVNKADVGALAPQLVIKEIEKETASLLLKTAGGTEVEILCKEVKLDEGGALTPSGAVSLERIQFTGCVVLLNKVLTPKCEAHTPGKANGSTLTEKITGLIVLDKVGAETFELVKLTPDVGTTVANLELGEACAIGESTNVTGELFIKDCKGNTSFTTEATTHLIEVG